MPNEATDAASITGSPRIDAILRWVGVTGTATVILFIMLPKHIKTMEAVQSSMNAQAIQAAAQTEVLRQVQTSLQSWAADQKAITNALTGVEQQLRDQSARLERLEPRGG